MKMQPVWDSRAKHKPKGTKPRINPQDNMKKRVAIVALSALLATSASAQQWGVEAGVNFATLTVDGADGTTGFKVGVTADFETGVENLLVKGAFEYSSKGAKDFSAGYLQIPIQASYRFPLTSSLDLDVNVGPYFAYAIAGDITEDEVDDMVNKFDFGLDFGVNLTLNSHIYVGLNYELGLVNVYDYSYDDDDWSESITGKNSTFLITVGYKF